MPASNHNSILTNIKKNNKNVTKLDTKINVNNKINETMDTQVVYQDTNKRPTPESICSSFPLSPSLNTTKTTVTKDSSLKNDHTKKKTKIRSR